jgi:hypothetical protein
MLILAAVLALAATPAARDPFMPYQGGDMVVECDAVHAAACIGADDFRITGIVSGTATPRVMLELKNGTSVMLRVGDVLIGGRIKAIRRTGVVVEHIAWSQVELPRRTLTVLPLG